MSAIRLKNIRQHNLKNFDLEIPLYKVTVITGVSGAGKSTLAFDVLYAEGQRRYVETFSAYLRQYLERLPRPQVESIEAIPPAIAISQTNPVKSSRSTVATLAEITSFAKMLWFRAATPFCPLCGREVLTADPYSAAQEVIHRLAEKRIVITAPLVVKDENLLREGLLQAGYFRLFMENRVCDLEEVEKIPEQVEILLDRLKVGEKDLSRLIEAFERGFKISGEIRVHTTYGEEIRFSKEARCPYCNFKIPEKSPDLFSFNSPVGACPECRGFGRVMDIDWDLVIPDPQKSLADGAISILSMPSFWEDEEELFDYCREKRIPLDQPWQELSQEMREKILYGDGDWYGVKGIFDWLETKKYKAHVRILLARYRAYLPCPSCQGTRFKKESLYFRLGDLDIASFYALSVKDARHFLEKLGSQNLDKATQVLWRELTRRVNYLDEVGLSYLTLDRQSRTLSGGEVARVLLTRALASELVETLYIFDEPTTGLHPRDTARIISFLKKLASQQNTVIVIEHDPEVILSADYVIDLGPGAGEAGGNLLFVGTGKDLVSVKTPTAEAIKEVQKPKSLEPVSPVSDEFLEVIGARQNNLKNIDVKIPLKALTVFTGVSGSGKSTLLELILYRGLKRLKGEATEPPGAFTAIKGAENINEVILIDQSPLAKSPRANPATYLKVYDLIRKLLANTPLAKEKGLSASAFSFNSSIGQCPHCEGLGFEVVEMQFLSDLYFPCSLCKGKRFKEEILQVRYKGKNVAEILELTFDEAISFFESEKELIRRLDAARALGLGYLRLGQPLNTLSGGEAQRLKMAKYLFLGKGQGHLFLLDEPTVGLHLKDIEVLVNALAHLVEKGNTVVVVEHHLELIRRASWVVDLGPEGGEQGGELLYQGPLAEFIARDTPTSRHLRNYLKGIRPF
ncbi:excinuclease ABC, A subunit [Thermodesulfatator indicus DSM 15286]|uniref:UvrABC system protein A n=1 Tax=Thermodesulfatator indicus (strain DSM 15286 / JCM 11887 / CIR29812) TaxID=667014 RepID=F8A9Y8_THEID|nr:excinuclease ABC subunit UvrA [Thermodesulfatator indicus]AEH44191.1 excinuclease ABC, A subunit [Thermodesulfatator indicus DSM 15286]